VPTATITSKGQITIPKAVRRALKLQARDKVVFLVEGDRVLLIPAHRRSILELRGALSATEPFPGTDEIRRRVAHERGEALEREAPT